MTFSLSKNLNIIQDVQLELTYIMNTRTHRHVRNLLYKAITCLHLRAPNSMKQTI